MAYPYVTKLDQKLANQFQCKWIAHTSEGGMVRCDTQTAAKRLAFPDRYKKKDARTRIYACLEAKMAGHIILHDIELAQFPPEIVERVFEAIQAHKEREAIKNNKQPGSVAAEVA